MPKIRAIHPGFWNDTTLAECSMGAQLFFIGLWNFADDAGVFEWHEQLLKSQIFPLNPRAEVAKYLNELIKYKRILSFTHNGKNYGQIINFPKYQKPDSRYVRYVLGDFDYVKSISHTVASALTRGEPPTDDDGDGVNDGDDEPRGETSPRPTYRQETISFYEWLSTRCIELKITNKTKIKAIDIYVNRYLGKLHFRPEMDGYFGWMVDNNKRVLHSTAVGNCFKRQSAYQKKQSIKVLEHKQAMNNPYLKKTLEKFEDVPKVKTEAFVIHPDVKAHINSL